MPVIGAHGVTTYHVVAATLTDEVMAEARDEMRDQLDLGVDYLDAAYKTAVNGWIGLSFLGAGDALRNAVFYHLVNEFRPAGLEVPRWPS